MGQQNVMAAALAAVLLAGCERPATPEETFRIELFQRSTGIVRIPEGDLVISEPIRLPKSARGLELRGGGHSRIVAAANFQGPALLIVETGQDITLADFIIEGNRDVLAKPFEPAPPENAFRVWYPNNGILADRVAGLRIERVAFRNVVHFPVLISRSSGIRISDVEVESSGALNAKGKNNLSGGILIEEGSTDFEVRNSRFRDIRGNALWTHSLFTSPQLADGRFTQNRFQRIGRDAIQVGHAKRVKVEGNTGREIGYPVDVIDVENGGTPVAIDTAGDVSESEYVRNAFDEINGKCFDLDGFHDGTVAENICVNRGKPEEYPHGHFGIVMNNTHPAAHANNVRIRGNLIDGARFGGLFLMGSGNQVLNNRFENLNLAGCNESSPGCVYKADEPKMLESGIYVGRGVARLETAKGNEIRNNTVTGHKMGSRCIAFGPGTSAAANTVASNTCRDAAPK